MAKMKGVGRGNNPASQAQGRRNIAKGPAGKKGRKPGPGRPKGSIEPRRQLMMALKGEAPGLLKRLVKLAKQGDVASLRTLLAPLIAPAKTNVMSYKFVTGRESLEDILIEFQNLEKNMSVGAVDAEEVAAVTKVLERHREALESAAAGNRREEFEQQEQLMAAIRNDAKAIRYARAFLVRWEIVAQEIEGEPAIVQAARAVTGDVQQTPSHGGGSGAAKKRSSARA